MKYLLKNIFLSIVTVFTVTMFFSCEGKIKEIQKLSTSEKFPEGIAEDFELFYTDSGRVKAKLMSKKNLNFSNQSFPYQEFPEGLKVIFYDKENNESTVTADYGIIYSKTNLIDLQGNVVLETHDGKRLEAPQLYWDQKNEWIFTEKNYTFTGPDTYMNGTGIDFNKEFTLVNANVDTGDRVIDE
ncbi:LPS export ABC transporter periplasmic protein LptC [Leptobacterium flavescens]|uniref:LPS export ABC transporter periplasmic protein LptC n=1 Tax=Leptobacterium flavescens TaxID=472055 RepID=A0A6P0USI2_9FLAO|nr:LPS export ABC transporter periplasmic protein LptC [Leptobacterium flavescens]NER14779.1 LPS export ABC transporter periplasmic protein LptC [Leptobacterium flavescens]